tara:strand:- start:30 stop:521 length:492 start_codon:yes stop_codon:yes gene_type:complete
MAGFHTKTFLKHDDYMTPKYAWENIQEYIPKDRVIWEAFFGDGTSGQYLEELGYNVIHNDNDFFESNEGDIVVSNPPFSKSKDIINRLKELDKPFVLIMPITKLITSYFRENFKDTEDHLQIIIPRKRIQFVKNGNEIQNKCNFDCFYYCYKMNLPRDIIWLE